MKLPGTSLSFSRRARRLSFYCLTGLSAGTLAAACDSQPILNDSDEDAADEGSGARGGDGDGDLGGAPDDIDIGGAGDNGSGASNGTGGGGPVCENASSDVELAPIFLAFAFDVSGSMGQYDRPQWWHDPVKKWEPVVEATTAFFEDPESEGISASMGLFPSLANKCVLDSYDTPEVSMTALPSTAFATTFSAYEAEVSDTPNLIGGSWRGSTPTLFAYQGTSGYLGGFQAANPDAKFAVVLVTDGTPQGCGGNDDISLISTAAGTLYDNGAGVPTYVIGIENPTTPPATLPAGWADWGHTGQGNGTCPTDDGSLPCTPPNPLANLNAVALAGGTESAFLINTEDPDGTKDAFRRTIDAIRTKAISCELGIPPHPTPGKTFDKDKIDVTVTVSDTTTRLDYDPTCVAPNSWRYDNEANATEIVLCAATCEEIQSTPGADLNVDFLCEDRPIIVH